MPNIRKTFNFRDGVQVDDEVLVVTGDRVGIGTTSPDKSLDVRGNVQVVGIVTADNSIISGVGTFGGVKLGSGIILDATSGVVTATSFKGDGSTLSNLPTSQWVDIDVGLGFTSIYNAGGNVGIATTDPRHGLQIGGQVNATPQQDGVGISSLGHIKATGIVTASTFNGDLTGNVTGDLTGTASNATLAATATVATNAQGLTGTPDITVRNINSAGIGTIATLGVTDFTAPTLKGYSTLRGIHGTTTTFVVTVAAKTSAHRYNGSGSSNGYKIDGVEAPFLTFTPGRTYRFDISDGTNALHPLRFYYDVDKTTAYDTSLYTISGQQGTAGAYVEITISDTTPTVLHYQCSSHAKMGNSIQTNSNVLDTEHDSTVRGTTTTTELAVTGVSTFTGNIDANGDLDVDGQSNLDNVSIVGVTTIAKGNSGGASANTDAPLVLDNSANSYIQFRSPNNKENGLLFGDDADNDAGNIIYNHSVNALTFATNGGSNERLRIASDGTVSVNNNLNVTGNVVGNVTSASSSIGIATATSLGIGTATANANIQIHNSSGASSIVIGKNPAIADNNLQLRYGGGASRFSTSEALDLINHGDGHFNYFLTGSSSFVWHKGNSNELMALTNTGNLGIGLTNPTHKLSVDGTSKVTGIATFGGAVFIDGVLTVQDATISNLVGNVNGSINSSSGLSTVTHLESVSVGVGTTANGDAMRVHSGVQNRFFINTDGNVGIKTTLNTPNIEFDVRGDAKVHHGLVVGVTTGLCAVDFSNCVDVLAEGGVSRAPLSYMLPPKVNTAQRNALTSRTGGTVPAGAMVFVTDLAGGAKLQVWNGSAWQSTH